MNIQLPTLEDFQRLENKIDQALGLLESSKSPKPQEWLKSNEVKDLLKCSDSSLKNYRDSGIIPSTRVGGTYYYALEDVHKLLNQKRKP